MTHGTGVISNDINDDDDNDENRDGRSSCRVRHWYTSAKKIKLSNLHTYSSILHPHFDSYCTGCGNLSPLENFCNFLSNRFDFQT